MHTIDTENQYGLAFCERLPMAFTHGLGTLVWDEAGKRYLDFTSGWGVTSLGHSHPAIVSTLANQAARLMQSPNAGFCYSPERAALLHVLKPRLPGALARMYFCNSGAEANDAALKLARKITRRNKVATTVGAFHGRSFNTLSVSRGKENSQRYLPQLEGVAFVPHGDLTALASVMDHDTAAVIVEPVQGEGGVRIPPPEWLIGVQRLCRQYGALLIVDEVQTGFCRTGRFFACEHSPTPVEPDLLTMAKGIGGGFPFAALAVTEAVASRLELDDHGGTYCGNPLGCALARTVVEVMVSENIADRVAQVGQNLATALRGLHLEYPALINEIRAIGLLCAIQLSDNASARRLTLACAEAGLLVVPTRNGIIRLLPDLLVTESHIAEAIVILRNCLRGLAMH